MRSASYASAVYRQRKNADPYGASRFDGKKARGELLSALSEIYPIEYRKAGFTIIISPHYWPTTLHGSRPTMRRGFEGEDLEYEERKKLMAAQKNAWLEQQVQERKAAQEERRQAEAAYMMAIKARDARAGELDKLERECRYRLGQANLRYNEALATEKKQLEQIVKEQEEADNTAEMYNNLTSDMLTENPDVAKSALGKNRAIGFMYKGMNQEELKKFYAAQKEQMAAAKAKREAEDKMEAEWQALGKSIQNEVARLDIQDQRKRRDIARQLMEENQLLALQQKEKEKYFKEVVYNNTPTDDYYAQFNTTTR
ncbi:jg17886 [Pararge aegeria aegeria]|uniref:Jg17886 protein n=1 Tax=Pararge aegeria aegeria TaxID=348720 RepID=A0A8S4SRY5_9NEOP|nr:jg17886 [Pararge aegeria aegeria]